MTQMRPFAVSKLGLKPLSPPQGQPHRAAHLVALHPAAIGRTMFERPGRASAACSNGWRTIPAKSDARPCIAAGTSSRQEGVPRRAVRLPGDQAPPSEKGERRELGFRAEHPNAQTKEEAMEDSKLVRVDDTATAARRKPAPTSFRLAVEPG